LEELLVQQLKERILTEGRVLPGNIIKIDGFLNHRVDVKLMRAMAREFSTLFDISGITAVLTIEASGIALGTVCAEEWDVPLVFAKKSKSDNIEGGLYKSDIFSYTYNKQVTLLVSRQWLGSDDKVLIVDDFLANGEALRGVVDIATQAGAEVLGIGIAVEKGFQPGGQRLRDAGYNLKSLAIIDRADENGIVFREEGR
jgi:xanthine phosphoribosyltransferase